MHYYLIFVVTLCPNGLKSSPRPYTVRASTTYHAEYQLREWLGEGRYEIYIVEPIGYDAA